METPYLTRKTCHRRYYKAVALWFFPAMLFLVCADLHLLALTALFGVAKLLVVGPVMGEAIYWQRLGAATRRQERLLDPLSPTVSGETRLPLYRYRLAGGSVIATLTLVISLIVALSSQNLFVLSIGLPPLLSFFWALYGYRKALARSQSAVQPPTKVVVSPTTWWTKDETRQEIRRR